MGTAGRVEPEQARPAPGLLRAMILRAGPNLTLTLPQLAPACVSQETCAAPVFQPSKRSGRGRACHEAIPRHATRPPQPFICPHVVETYRVTPPAPSWPVLAARKSLAEPARRGRGVSLHGVSALSWGVRGRSFFTPSHPFFIGCDLPAPPLPKLAAVQGFPPAGLSKNAL